VEARKRGGAEARLRAEVQMEARTVALFFFSSRFWRYAFFRVAEIWIDAAHEDMDDRGGERRCATEIHQEIATTGDATHQPMPHAYRVPA